MSGVEPPTQPVDETNVFIEEHDGTFRMFKNQDRPEGAFIESDTVIRLEKAR